MDNNRLGKTSDAKLAAWAGTYIQRTITFTKGGVYYISPVKGHIVNMVLYGGGVTDASGPDKKKKQKKKQKIYKINFDWLMTCRVGKSLPVKLRLLSNDSPFEMVFGGYLVFNEPAHIDSSPSIRRAGKNENRRDSMGPAVCVPSPSQQQRRNEKTGRRSVGSVALRAQGRHRPRRRCKYTDREDLCRVASVY